jgi:lipopolysaccharide export system permease protein
MDAAAVRAQGARMSYTVVRYVSRLFVVHLLPILIGFVAMVQILDLLNNADEITARHGNNLSALVTYAGLRLPQLVNLMLPFAVLMAALLSLARLVRGNEIIALKAGGFSFYRLLMAFVPIAMFTGGVYFIVNDQLVPWTTDRLAIWDAAPDAPKQNSRPVWLRDGQVLVGVEGVSEEGHVLTNVRVFERNGNGILAQQITARKAVNQDGKWTFFDTWRFDMREQKNTQAIYAAQLPWETLLTPAHFANLATDPATLSFRDLVQFILKPNVGARAVYFYETWLHHKLTLPFSLLVMILLAAPVAQALQRQGGMATGLALGVALGFLYFVCQGLMLTLGETGAMAPLIAAWAPPALFAALGVFWLLRVEGY